MTFSFVIDYNKRNTANHHYNYILDKLCINKCFVKISPYIFVKIYDKINNVDELKNYYINNYGYIPKYIIFVYNNNFISLMSKLNIICELSKLIMITDDLHTPNDDNHKFKCNIIENAHIIFSPYGYNNFNDEKYKLSQPKKLVNLYHSARLNYICNINDNPINKILISGVINSIYIDREYAVSKQLIYPDKIDRFKKTIKYRVANHNNIICGKKYYEYLNKYLCCFCDIAYDYILAKVFEIPASGSLLLYMDKDNEKIKNIMKEMGFIDGENYISCNRTDFIEKVMYITDPNNKSEIDRIRINGYDLIKQHHTSENRYQTVIQNIEKYD